MPQGWRKKRNYEALGTYHHTEIYNRCASPQKLPPNGWLSVVKSRPNGCCHWPKQPLLPPDNVLPFVYLTPAVADRKPSAECL